MGPTVTLVTLHFVGTRLYTDTKFEEEAGRIGVARALPAFALRNLAYGEVIVLATFKPNPRVVEDEPQDPIPFLKTTYPRIGSADAWGYFVVNGVMRTFSTCSMSSARKSATSA